MQRLADEKLVFPAAVEIAGVDDVHAALDGHVDGREAFGLVPCLIPFPAPMPIEFDSAPARGAACGPPRLIRQVHLAQESLRLTYARTYCAGSNRTTWPAAPRRRTQWC